MIQVVTDAQKLGQLSGVRPQIGRLGSRIRFLRELLLKLRRPERATRPIITLLPVD
jgi:hypothetical protein